jgi:hypothetical protein
VASTPRGTESASDCRAIAGVMWTNTSAVS